MRLMKSSTTVVCYNNVNAMWDSTPDLCTENWIHTDTMRKQ